MNTLYIVYITNVAFILFIIYFILLYIYIFSGVLIEVDNSQGSVLSSAWEPYWSQYPCTFRHEKTRSL